MKTIENQVAVFKALSDLTRVRIMKMLQVKPLCVCEITDVLGLSASTVSEHLSILRESGLILSEKRGKIIFQKINFYSDSPSVSAMLSVLSCLMNEDPLIKDDKKKATKVDCRVILARKQ